MSAMRLRSDAGQSLVEFALASSLFLVSVLGLLTFGVAVSRFNLVADLAQEGARRASVCGVKKALTAASACNISTYVNGRALGLVVTVTPTPTDVSTLTEGSTVSVLVSYTYTPIPWVRSGTLNLHSTAKMIVQR